jgi:hypothetical protein
MGGVVAAWVVERARRKAVLQGARPIAANILWRRPQTGEGWSCWGGKDVFGRFFDASLSMSGVRSVRTITGIAPPLAPWQGARKRELRSRARAAHLASMGIV